VSYTTFRTAKGGAFKSLLVALGVPVGNKRNSSFEVPKWLFAAPLNVKREFLAGYMGGDGTKPIVSLRKERKSSSKVILPPTIFHKREDLLESGMEFAGGLKDLFLSFGVKISSIDVREGYARKDGTKTKKIIFITLLMLASK